MTFLTGIVASVAEFFLQLFVRDFVSWCKEQKAQYDQNQAVKQKTDALVTAVKNAKTDEEIKNAAKDIADYIAALPPR